ncbi:hypothetical protein S2E19_05426 [Bacillus mycoides]|nr:hypothetical protein S2E19_05426 [Bacillus mycoides]
MFSGVFVRIMKNGGYRSEFWASDGHITSLDDVSFIEKERKMENN